MTEIKPEEKRQLKPGWRTTEFWTAVGAPIVGVLAPLVVQTLPPTWTAALATVSGIAYSISRGLAKLGIGR